MEQSREIKNINSNSHKIFAFEYCWCRFESGFSVMTLHTTKLGAYRAMMKHKNECWYTEREDRYSNVEEIGWRELWRIKEYIVIED